MLNFVQYGACLHLSVQNVWGSLFSGHTVELHTGGHPACKLWLRYGDVGGLGE